jgi:hypothetical protein
MNQIEKLASAHYLIKKAEMDVGTSALTGGALGSLLLALLSKGRRMGTGYRPSKGPYTAFPKIKTGPSKRKFAPYNYNLGERDLQMLGGIAGGVGGAGTGGLLAALSNTLNKENN